MGGKAIIRVISLWIIVLAFVSCNKKKSFKVNARAIELNNKGMQVYSHNPLNRDSIRYALSLINRAIATQPDCIDLYYNKLPMFEALGKIDSCLSVTNQLISIDSLDYRVYYAKGKMFDKLNNIDSSRYHFFKCLSLIDESVLLSRIPMYRDYKKIKVYYFLKDTINYKEQLAEFKQKYVSENDYQGYIDDIENEN